MKPTKNRIYCNDCGRKKMLFETEKKANLFIKFNYDEIKNENGYSPTRAYFCICCNGWHVTSSEKQLNTKSKTEIVLELYRDEKEKREIQKDKIKEIRKAQAEKIEMTYAKINNLINIIREDILKRNKDNLDITLDDVFSEFEKVNSYDKNDKRKKMTFNMLIEIKNEINNLKSNNTNQ